MENRVKIMEGEWEECRKRLVEAVEATTTLNDQITLGKQRIQDLTALNAELEEELANERFRVAQHQEEIDDYRRVSRELSVGYYTDRDVSISPASSPSPLPRNTLAVEMVGFS